MRQEERGVNPMVALLFFLVSLAIAGTLEYHDRQAVKAFCARAGQLQGGE